MHDSQQLQPFSFPRRLSQPLEKLTNMVSHYATPVVASNYNSSFDNTPTRLFTNFEPHQFEDGSSPCSASSSSSSMSCMMPLTPSSVNSVQPWQGGLDENYHNYGPVKHTNHAAYPYPYPGEYPQYCNSTADVELSDCIFFASDAVGADPNFSPIPEENSSPVPCIYQPRPIRLIPIIELSHLSAESTTNFCTRSNTPNESHLEEPQILPPSALLFQPLTSLIEQSVESMESISSNEPSYTFDLSCCPCGCRDNSVAYTF